MAEGVQTAALGLRSHSGWAALVAVAGPPADPTVVLRRRLELSRKTPRQPFHAAEGRPFAEAAALVRRSTDEASKLAESSVREALIELLFRDALRQASRRCGLRLIEVKERDLEDPAVRSLRLSPTELQRRFAAWGKALGPPWTQDQKRAALVAWVALVE
jgi:hypothetical protein